MNDRSNQRPAFDPDQGYQERPADPYRERPAHDDARLAELARIVGQDDPFKALLARGPGGRPAAGARPAASGDWSDASQARQGQRQAAPAPEWPAAERRDWNEAPPAAGGQHADWGAETLRGSTPEWDNAAAYQAPDARYADDRQQAHGYDATQGGYAAGGEYGYAQGAHPGHGADAGYAAGYDDAAYAEQRWAQPGYADQAAPQPAYAASHGYGDPAQQGYGAGAYDNQGYAGAEPGYPDALDPNVALAPDEAAYDEEESGRKSSRLRFAVIGVALLAVAGGAGAYVWKRGTGVTGNGEPPVIQADATPAKVEPQPQGATVDPTVNKQIYDRAGQPPSTDTKVVDRQEQPVDVKQAIRQQADARGSSRAVPAEHTTETQTFGAPAVKPLPSNPSNRNPTAGLGEPRRVKTVAVRPDGTIVTTGSVNTQPSDAPSQAPAKPKVSSPATPATTPKQMARVSDASESAPLRSTDSAPMSIAPLSQPASQVASASGGAMATSAKAGTFSVQLAAPGSESEARGLFANLKRKYGSELDGMQPIIVKAAANGKTIYRLRVGQMSREEAADLCTRLKSAGGSCFVARN